MNLALEKGERVPQETKAEVKLERSLGWLQIQLSRMAWCKRYGMFSGWGMARIKFEFSIFL